MFVLGRVVVAALQKQAPHCKAPWWLTRVVRTREAFHQVCNCVGSHEKVPETLLTYPYNKHCADVQSKLNRQIAWGGSRQYLGASCGSASSGKPGGPRNCREPALIALNINRSSYFLTMTLDWLFPTRSMTSNFIGQPAFPLSPGSATQSVTTPHHPNLPHFSSAQESR